MSIPAYIINLPRDLARRRQIEAQLAELPGIVPHFVTGVDGGTLPDQVCEKLSDSASWAANKGTIGCFLSHVRVWELLAAGAAPYGIVLEDDVDISGLRALERLRLPDDFECIFINDRMSPKSGGEGLVGMAEALGRPDHPANFGGDGYILTPGGAAKLVAACVEDLYFGHVDGRLARYASSPEALAALGDTHVAAVLRTHHLRHRLPRLGLLKSYVSAMPLVRYKVFPSSRALRDAREPPPLAGPPQAPPPGAAGEAPVEMVNDVLIGRDGYLFLAGGGHSVADYVTGKRGIEPRNFEIFRQNLDERAAWAAANGARHLHLIMPDKQSVVPEAWTMAPPRRLGALYATRNADIADRLIYPADLLAAHKPDSLTRVDTHFSEYGSLLVTRLLAERLSGEQQDGVFGDVLALLDREVTAGGDLGGKLDPPLRETRKTLRAGPPGVLLVNDVEGGNNGMIDLHFNTQAKYRERVLIFGDSFIRDIARLLRFWFTEVYFFRSGFFHPEIADQCRPDILITENVERYMHECASNDERPPFLIYPYFLEKPYRPSKAFARALAGVLSYPRKPYQDFMVSLAGPPPAPPAAEAPAPPLTIAVPPNYRAVAAEPQVAEVLRVLEAPRRVARRMPEFVVDPAGRDIALDLPGEQSIHGSSLVQGLRLRLRGACQLTRVEGTLPEDAEMIEAPVFLATALAPEDWGSWILTVLPKIAQYRQYGEGRKLLCHAGQGWQRNLLRELGIAAEMHLDHELGRTYVCRDLMTVAASERNGAVSALERMGFFELVARNPVRSRRADRIFVTEAGAPGGLAALLEPRGFVTIRPGDLALAEQIGLFSAAGTVVCASPPALFNAVFCAPGTRVLSIEADPARVHAHAEFLASLEVEYGFVLGAGAYALDRLAAWLS